MKQDKLFLQKPKLKTVPVVTDVYLSQYQTYRLVMSYTINAPAAPR